MVLSSLQRGVVILAVVALVAAWSRPSWAEQPDRAELLQRAAEWQADDDEEDQQTFLDDLKASYPKGKLTEDDVKFAEELSQRLAQWSDAEASAKAFEALGEAMGQLEGKRAVRLAQHYKGTARRLRLVGNEMEMVGTLLDGEKFDWAPYKGKVVLVEFWATWCKPCIIVDMPKVEEEYRLYHDKGFEVIGVSLDFKKEDVTKFVEDRKTPWPTLYDGPIQNCPLSMLYGVNSIPLKVLIGKDGKVVAVNPQDLPAEMEKLLGPVEGRRPGMSPEEEMSKLFEAYGITPQKLLEQAMPGVQKQAEQETEKK